MGKYFKYAIGEILLVVIGILIALQINNWNDQNNENKEHQKFLINLKNDLQNDLNQLDEIIGYQNKKFEIVKSLKAELIGQNKFEVVEKLFAQVQNTSNNTFFPNTGNYTTAVSSGLIANLKPDSLKIAITNLYERYYRRLIYNGEIYDERTDEIALKRGKFYNKLSQKLINKEVIYDSEFTNLVSIVVYDNETYLKMGADTRKEIINIIQLINRNFNKK